MKLTNSWRSRRLWLALIVMVVVGIGGYFALVKALQALPPRYLSMLPDPLQDLGRIPHPDLLPTPVGLTEPIRLEPWPTLSPEEAEATTEPTDIPPTLPPTATAAVVATDQPVALPTEQPTNRPTRRPTTPPTATTVPIPASMQLDGFRFAYQTWNNCGPATISVDLSYYGWAGDQAQAATFLKPDKEDKNVSPDELVAFANSVGLQAQYRVNGTIQRLKRFLQAGIPVIVETGYDPEPHTEGWMGHYRLITGYDDPAGQLRYLDVYRGAGDKGTGLAEDYTSFDTFWQHFNRTYILVYRAKQAAQVQAILGADADSTAMYKSALARAQAEAAANPKNAFAWFNVGSSLVGLGRYSEAAQAYDQARLVGLPWRMLWYQFGAYEAYYRIKRYDDIFSLAATVLKPAPNLEESLYYRGLAQEALGQKDAARASFQAALRYNPNYAAASQELAKIGG